MPYDRFLVAPINGSLQTDLRPWLIPEQSFTQLNNAYVFRGRVRKRFGGQLTGAGATTLETQQLFSRVRIQVATITAGAASGTVPGNKLKVGQLFSIGNEIFTVQALGTPIVMLNTGTTTIHTYNTTTGAFNFAGSPAVDTTPVYFYPAEPIMGLTVYELGAINNQPAFAFDTQFAYEYAGGSWPRSITGITPTWHGTNSQFFWSSNWAGLTSSTVVLFTTNFNLHIGLGLVTDDPIWAYSSEFTVPGWQPFSYSPDILINTTNQQPYTVTQTNTTSVAGDTIANYVQSARIIVAFKDRLLLLNTIENNALGANAFDPMNPTTTGITPTNYLTSTNTPYVNRCRFSHNGSPFSDSAWLEPNFVYKNGSNAQVQADGGGFIDATTEEAIISAEFIKDRLIVYFERSTWELAYTGNQVLPFVWQKINTELGSESTFSIVPFDKVVLGISNVGVHACNGANVERIDNFIPDEIFEIKNKEEGVSRVAGIRDYFAEMVYWTFPSDDEGPDQVFPNRLLLYNYKTGSWALADDCITTFGYFEQQNDTTWQTADGNWEEADFTWNSGVLEAQFRQVIAGNQQGFIFLVLRDEGRNAPAMQISNITINSPMTATLTITDHTLNFGDYILIENAQGVSGFNLNIFMITYITVNTISITADNGNTFTGTYTGAGTATRVSNVTIKSKQLNPYVNKGRNVYLARIDFCVQKTSSGEITVDYYPSSTSLSMISAAQATLSNMGNNILETSPYALYPLENAQERLWHTVYFQTEGEFVQFIMYFSDAQMKNLGISLEDFQLEGFILQTQPTSSRLQ